jgi:hypothetical protein
VSRVSLGVEAVEALHKEQIDLFGGSHGIRDAGLLESAVMRAEFKAKFDSAATLGANRRNAGIWPDQEPCFYRWK